MTNFLCVVLALAWKRLSTYVYFLVLINMLSFNHMFVMFLIQTVVESNQVLTDAFKYVKILSKCEFQRVEL